MEILEISLAKFWVCFFYRFVVLFHETIRNKGEKIRNKEGEKPKKQRTAMEISCFLYTKLCVLLLSVNFMI